MTAGEWLKDAARALETAGVPDARLDAEWMLADALGVGRSRLRFHLDDAPDDEKARLLGEWLSRRQTREPLQYVQGRAYFMGLELFSAPGALIPRQDSEILCEEALRRLKPGGAALDLCTGSGALAVAIQSLRPDARVTATDLSEDALRIARENARRAGVEVEWLQGDLLRPVRGRAFDVVLCNPPYVATGELDSLQAEVAFEPRMALDGGRDGMDFYRRIAPDAASLLRPEGSLLFEVGAGQAERVAALFSGGAFDIEIFPDLCGVQRVVALRKRTVDSVGTGSSL